MKSIQLISIILALFVVTACSKPEVKKMPLSKEESSFIWSAEQKKSFSQVELPSVSEEEAMETIRKKYTIELSDFYHFSEDNIKNSFVTSGLTFHEPLYTIQSREETLLIRTLTDYGNKATDYHLYGIVEANYRFYKSEKKVRLSSQSTIITSSNLEIPETAGGVIPFLKSEAEAMKLNMPDEIINKYQEAMKMPKEERIEKKVPLYDDSKATSKNRTLGRVINLSFNSKGEPSEIEATITDYSH